MPSSALSDALNSTKLPACPPSEHISLNRAITVGDVTGQVDVWVIRISQVKHLQQPM